MRRLSLSACLLVAPLIGCGFLQKPIVPAGILIITLDTTRADYLTAYGAGRAMTPHLDRIAADGVLFERAATVAPITVPAHSSLFTGLLPPRHGVRDNAGSLDGRHQTLATILRGRGFDTAAFVGSVVLAASRGLNAGFDVYGDGRTTGRALGPGLQRSAQDVVDEAVAWLDTRDGSPFFLWVHLYDPHAPYDPPEPYRTAYRDDLYAGEIAFADEQIGRLLDVLDRRGMFEWTAVVVAADHGESLNEHHEAGHGFFIYESVVRIPLIVRAAGLSAGRVANVVRIVDVMPTLLDLVDAPAVATDGVSLLDVMTGASSSRELHLAAYAESLSPERFGWSRLTSLRSGRFKLIEAPRPELYDLEADPAELTNLHASLPAVAAAMSRRLSGLTRDLTPSAAAGEPARPSAETIAQLTALGYVGAGRPPAVQRGAVLPDPKDHIHEYNELARRHRETSGRR